MTDAFPPPPPSGPLPSGNGTMADDERLKLLELMETSAARPRQ